MVRAILAGRKTQTRRVIKPVPTFNGGGTCHDADALQQDYVEPHWVFPKICKYGAPGDTLWVRETWCLKQPLRFPSVHYRADGEHVVLDDGDGFTAVNKDGSEKSPWRSSIHMPRWASRITLRITDVRVERLQDISEDDARAEGATMRPSCNGFQHRYPGWSMDWSEVGKPSYFATGAQRGKKAPLTESDVSLGSAKWAFASLWNRINGLGAWDDNSWVWVISFERVKP
jgi:hypothetical protein